jgi:hypothetical protein
MGCAEQGVYDWLAHQEKGRGFSLRVEAAHVEAWLKLYGQEWRDGAIGLGANTRGSAGA